MRIGQGVAPGPALDYRPTQITLEVGKMRPGNMPFGVAALAIIHILQSKTTIENHQPRRVQPLGQLLRGEQLRKGPDNLLIDGTKALATVPEPG